MRSVRLGLLGEGAPELRLKEGRSRSEIWSRTLPGGKENLQYTDSTARTSLCREQEIRPVWLEQSERERAGHEAKGRGRDTCCGLCWPGSDVWILFSLQ